MSDDFAIGYTFGLLFGFSMGIWAAWNRAGKNKQATNPPVDNWQAWLDAQEVKR